jgi:hypothetical protein
MSSQQRARIYLVHGKQVAIIKSNRYTYNVRFVKSGKFREIYKHLVIRWEPKPKKTIKVKKIKSQTKLDFQKSS